MKYEVDFSQPSTIRGIVWCVTGLAAFVMIWLGKDVGQVLAVGTAVAGGLGVAVKD